MKALEALLLVGIIGIGGYFIYKFVLVPQNKAVPNTPIFSSPFMQGDVPLKPVGPSSFQASNNSEMVPVGSPLVCNPKFKGHCWYNFEYIRTKIPNIKQVTDTITIVKDLGNRIPDHSQQLIMNLEYFMDVSGGAGASAKGEAELNLWCKSNTGWPPQENGKTFFAAISSGILRYTFKIPVIVGHTYQRTMTRDPIKGTITYILKDLTTGQQEPFIYRQTIAMQKTGIFSASHAMEYHNLANGGSNSVFPSRFAVTTTSPIFS